MACLCAGESQQRGAMPDGVEPEAVSLQSVGGLMACLCAGESQQCGAMPDGVPFGE